MANDPQFRVQDDRFEGGASVPADVVDRLSSLERSTAPSAGPSAADMVRRYARALVDVQRVVDETL